MQTDHPHQPLIHRLRALTRRGAYAEAVAAAALLPPVTRHHPAVALRLVRAAMLQGNMALAETWLAAVDLKAAEPGLALVLRLERAGIQVYCAADFAGALAAAEAAFAHAANAQISPALRAEAERVHLRIRLTAATYYLFDQATVVADLARLLQLAEILALHGWIDEALSARLTYAKQQRDPPARLIALAAVIDMAEAADRPAVAAEALVNRAHGRYKLSGSLTECEADLERAERYYMQTGHRIGLIDIAHLRARHAIEHEHAAATGWEATLAAYQAEWYYRGILHALLDLSQLAHHRGDIAAALHFRQALVRQADAVGMGLLRESEETALIDLFMRNHNFGAAIETARAALATHPTPFMAAGFEQLLATAYHFVDDLPAATHHIRRALAAYEQLGITNSASEAAGLLASYLDSQRQDSAWSEAEALLQRWEEHDAAAHAIEPLLTKRELRTQLRVNRFLHSPQDRGNPQLLVEADELLALALSMTSQLQGIARVRREGALWQMRGQVAQLRGDEEGVHTAWSQARDCYTDGGLGMEAANCAYILGVLHLNRANRMLQPNFGLAEEHLRTALNYYEGAYMRGQAADTRYMFAKLYTNASLAVDPPLHDQLLDAALDHLSLAEADYDAIRREFSVGTVLEAQRGKRALIAKSHRIYTQALEIVMLHRRDAAAAWSWTQRAKARALTDALGAGAIIPAPILTALADHPTALALVKQEEALVTTLETAGSAEIPAYRAQLAELYTRMRDEPALVDYLLLRHGFPLQPADLAALATGGSGQPMAVLFVDWMVVEDRILFFALRPGEEPYVERMGTPVHRVADFVATHLNERTFRLTLRDYPELLRQFDALITPLSIVSKPGELLILSPSGPLHALPLHALEIDGRPLLARNPIVYTPSLSVLRHTTARTARGGALHSAALFGDPSNDTDSAAQLVHQLQERLDAATVTTAAYLRDEVTRATFATAAPQRDLLYFHGHARHDASDPLASYLQLADGHFTAADIFGLRGLSAELVILAACESAANVIATGDEPLGLIPAFLYAGSHSVIAGQWRIQRRAAAQWLEHFFQALLPTDPVDAHSPEGNAVTFACTKAQAFQQATLALAADPHFSAPYYWAPFVLYGNWH